MELSDYVGQPCKSNLAFEFSPKNPLTFNLRTIVELLKKKEFEIELETPIFISILVEKTSASIFQNGKILVKDTREKEDAIKIAQKIVKAIKNSN